MTTEEINAELEQIMKMPYVSLEEGFRAAKVLQAQAVANGVAGMSMDEIDAIIAECRRERGEGRK